MKEASKFANFAAQARISASTIAGALGAGFTAGLNEISLGARTEKVLNKDTNKMEKITKYTRAEGLNSIQNCYFKRIC